MASEFTYIETNFKDSSEEDKLIKQSAQKRRRSTRTWREREKFLSAAEAKRAIKQLKSWKVISSKTTSAGKRVKYRCIHGQYRVSECPAGLYLSYHSPSNCVSLYKTDNEHANHADNPTRGLSSDVKIFIQQKYEDGITKQNAILKIFCQNQMVEPAKSKLVEFLKTLRINKNTPSVSASEIRTWCNEQLQIPCDEDEPYVIDFRILAESYDLEEQDL